MEQLIICPTFKNSSKISPTHSFTSSVPLVSIRLVCPSNGLTVKETQQTSNARPRRFVAPAISSICAQSQPSCADSSSSECTICATEPPGARDHFLVLRNPDRNTGSDVASGEWTIELVKEFPSHCHIKDASIKIYIKYELCNLKFIHDILLLLNLLLAAYSWDKDFLIEDKQQFIIWMNIKCRFFSVCVCVLGQKNYKAERLLFCCKYKVKIFVDNT